MRLGYFTMPVHPMERDWSQTLREDREAIILADELGFYDAFVGEHLTDACESITNSTLFLATLIHSTKRIKLATGTTNLSQMHPVVIAANAAMFDHLAQHSRQCQCNATLANLRGLGPTSDRDRKTSVCRRPLWGGSRRNRVCVRFDYR